MSQTPITASFVVLTVKTAADGGRSERERRERKAGRAHELPPGTRHQDSPPPRRPPPLITESYPVAWGPVSIPSHFGNVVTEGGLTQSDVAAQLTPYVPRLTLEWIRDAPHERSRRIDGTLVFVDVSGFTRMSERLATLGRAGAEEVNGVMNATFAGLLDVAYRFGGGLLKFGGDALLLFYDGEDHAPRAATAAFRMRALLRQIGRPVTAGGRVTLRMHVGIHSGPFDFFLVGSSHRELVVTGPGATRTVEMEGLAAADEILLSDDAAALLPGARPGRRASRGPAACAATRRPPRSTHRCPT